MSAYNFFKAWELEMLAASSWASLMTALCCRGMSGRRFWQGAIGLASAYHFIALQIYEQRSEKRPAFGTFGNRLLQKSLRAQAGSVRGSGVSRVARSA